MSDTIRYRGPDDAGLWADEAAGVALAHRRLAVIDLSSAGHQPMQSHCGRYQLVFNGEIYNHHELRAELGVEMRGHSDTEVLVQAIAAWGLPRTVDRLNGQFAFAVWDSEQRTLSLVRDRIGIKPLYYATVDGTFIFASELKALRAHPTFAPEINRTALGDLLEHCYIPGDRTIYTGVFKLPPAHTLTVTAETIERPVRSRYWSIPFEASTTDGWNERFQTTLNDAVRMRMLSDVPLGAFLSGGIDSSLIVSLMQALSSRPVRTFTIGFEEPEFNEAPHGAAIAEHLGTDHTELYVSPREARDVIPLLPQIYDEPFADVSQIPTWLVCRLAREHVTVCLSGDGGDELFGGYERYHHIRDIDRRRRQVPGFARGGLAALITHPLFRKLRGRSPRDESLWHGVLNADNLPDLYRFLHRHWRHPEQLVVGYADEDRDEFRQSPQFPADAAGDLATMMSIDQQAYLPDDILVKVDRASMNVSLEARVPLLDHRIVEMAWQLDRDARLSGAIGKQALRRILREHVPDSLFDRPKRGFGVPIDSWLRGPLRDWAEELLDADRLQREGFLEPQPIREKWQQHLDGTADWHYLLWDVLMFQSWLNADAGVA